MKNDDISAAAFHRFISQPASGRSSALPCLAAILVLSEIWRLLRLHGLFFGTKLYDRSIKNDGLVVFHELLEQPQNLLSDRRASPCCKAAQVLFGYDHRCLTSKSLRSMCQVLLTKSKILSSLRITAATTLIVFISSLYKLQQLLFHAEFIPHLL